MLEKIKKIEREYLLPNEVAKVLDCNPHYIRLQARSNPELLGFKVICIGSRVRIPKIPFIKFMEEGTG